MRIDFSKIKTYSIKRRISKVNTGNFAKVGGKNRRFNEFFNNLPEILAANDFRNIVESILRARKRKKPVIIMIGGHVVKCGLNPLIIELIKKNVFTAIAMNGATSIHDFELSIAGKTSEDVETSIKDGSFGMAEETGKIMNIAINEGVKKGYGMGESLARKINEIKAPFRKYSILANAFTLKAPVTVHVAIGTDIIHQHPEASGMSLGEGSFIDFKKFINEVSKLEAGVIMNIGSAVIMPEVFLKALTVSRNLGFKVNNFTAVNFDMIQQYRPRVNVLYRPTLNGGKAYSITGHHEIMIPLLVQAIIEGL